MSNYFKKYQKQSVLKHRQMFSSGTPAVHKYVHRFVTVFVRIIKVQFKQRETKLEKSDHVQPPGPADVSAVKDNSEH